MEHAVRREDRLHLLQQSLCVTEAYVPAKGNHSPSLVFERVNYKREFGEGQDLLRGVYVSRGMIYEKQIPTTFIDYGEVTSATHGAKRTTPIEVMDEISTCMFSKEIQKEGSTMNAIYYVHYHENGMRSN